MDDQIAGEAGGLNRPSTIVDVHETRLKAPSRWAVIATVTNDPKDRIATLKYRPTDSAKDHSGDEQDSNLYDNGRYVDPGREDIFGHAHHTTDRAENVQHAPDSRCNTASGEVANKPLAHPRTVAQAAATGDRRPATGDWRIDVVAIDIAPDGSHTMDIIENAVGD